MISYHNEDMHNRVRRRNYGELELALQYMARWLSNLKVVVDAGAVCTWLT